MRIGTLLRWYALKNILKSKIRDGLTILDIGGYDGFIAGNLKKMLPNIKITIVDLDKSGLQIAKERGLKTLCISATKLPLENNSIDVVLCLDLIEHVKEDDKLVKEISRVLKKDGKVILTTPFQNGVSFPFLNEKKLKIINKNWGHTRKGYSLSQIRELFKNNGLIIEKVSKYFNFLSRFIYWFNSFSGIHLKGKNLLYRMVIRLEPYVKYGANEHIIVGKKVDHDL